jgi:RNA polymerase sigma-70 factor (ECF subfamily)
MLANSASVVDDVFQLTWTRILQNLNAYTDKQRFLSWAFRIAHNLAIDHFRQQARMQTVELPDRLPDERPDPWERMDREAVGAALAEAIAQLSPEQREVLELRRQGISFKDIADVQNASINTVLGRMHYAVKHLQRLMQDYT